MQSITMKEFIEKRGNLRVIDVRETDEYAAGHVPDALNIPMSEVGNRVAELQDGNAIICQSGRRSLQVAGFLDSKGVDVINIEGGTSAYPYELEV